ncbi:fasciclin-like arabinogalactan protein 11 [Sesbania bispinosa]|nr:fasciclin-like arabinogalactan protein 11 [Sesbania bispinosa]
MTKTMAKEVLCSASLVLLLTIFSMIATTSAQILSPVQAPLSSPPILAQPKSPPAVAVPAAAPGMSTVPLDFSLIKMLKLNLKY